jgi:hypothetical protein
MSQAKSQFEKSKTDVDDLLNLHVKLSGIARGRRPSEIGILNKSAIIFCAAIWEAYIEDVVEEAVKHLATHVTDRTKLPTRLVALIEQQNADLINRDKTRIWNVASKSIGDLVRDQAKRAANTVPSSGKEFNTAKTKPVSDLVEACLGLASIESFWNWRKMKSASASAILDKFIKLRGDLAHGNKSVGDVNKSEPSKMLNHIVRLVEKTDEAITKHLTDLTGVSL